MQEPFQRNIISCSQTGVLLGDNLGLRNGHETEICSKPHNSLSSDALITRQLGYRHTSSVKMLCPQQNCFPYADDQILMATSEDDLQTMAHHLNLIARKYKMTISSTKTKSMAMWGNHIQRVKIVINDNIIKQVTDFKYLGYRISEYGSDLEDKLQT